MIVEENKTNILAVPLVKIKTGGKKKNLEKLKEQRKIYKKVKF
jgi:hypothetical protein